MATTIPVPGLVGAKVFSSSQPLKTHPNPPSPRRLSERKFLEAFLRSLKLKSLTLLEADISLLDDTKILFKVPKGVCWLEEVESLFALLGGFVRSEEAKWKSIRQLGDSLPTCYAMEERSQGYEERYKQILGSAYC